MPAWLTFLIGASVVAAAGVRLARDGDTIKAEGRQQTGEGASRETSSEIKTDDGRVLFLIPWYDAVLVGTTDTPCSLAADIIELMSQANPPRCTGMCGALTIR